MSALEHAHLEPALEVDYSRAAREAVANRTAALPRRRGWLMPRMLLGADLRGLTAALFARTLIGSAGAHHLDGAALLLLLVVASPTSLVEAKLHLEDDREEQRADNSTV